MACFEVMVLVKGWVAEVFSSYQIPQRGGGKGEGGSVSGSCYGKRQI
jgi:hypothetical protein